MFANPRHRSSGNGLLVPGNRLTEVGHQFLRHGDCASITTQQQTVAFKRRQILANRNFRGFESLGQLIHTHFAPFIKEGKDIVASLGCIALRHGWISFDSKDNVSNKNLSTKLRQACRDKKSVDNPKKDRSLQQLLQGIYVHPVGVAAGCDLFDFQELWITQLFFIFTGRFQPSMFF
jgi:hypothetical protein